MSFRGRRSDGKRRFAKGLLRRLNEVFLQRDVNIMAQYLETDSEIGYVVLDADLTGQDTYEILDDIRALDGTIRARLVSEKAGL
jgi:D-3-phosphoglycerate dehydrogenase / 2-oxoglutarate reductase